MKIWKIALVLGLIAGISGLLIAAVNSLTEDKIAENELNKKNELVEEFFPDADTKSINWIEVDEKYSKVEEKTEIKNKNGDIEGSVYVASGTNAYGEIILVLAVNNENEIIGIKYLSLNQTPGFGDKVDTDEYKDKYVGQEIESINVDAVSGATYSSNLVSDIVAEIGLAHTGGTINEKEATEVPIYWFGILGMLLIGGPILIWKVGGKREGK